MDRDENSQHLISRNEDEERSEDEEDDDIDLWVVVIIGPLFANRSNATLIRTSVIIFCLVQISELCVQHYYFINIWK